MNNNNTNTTALYIRLSQEDDNVGESDSVKNQRDLLNDFVAKHPDLSTSKVLHFIDDGYSGTTFARPAITKMLDAVRKGEVQAIVVKDFSRFGRNYIEVGSYLEQVFPFLGVRFLSVNDFFDSNDNMGKSVGLEVGFKALIHDLYSKDLGIKTTTGKLAKTKKGEHIGGTAPFGYVKSKKVKNAWEIDEEAAATVRRIYSLCIEGKTFVEIANILNTDNTPSPLKHRENKGTLHQVVNGARNGMSVWRKQNVSTVLREERYTGKLISGKLKRLPYGEVKTKAVPKDEWIVVENAHEAIISQEDFDQVQSILKPYNTRTFTRVNSNKYAGKLFCGHCGHGLRKYGDRPSRPNSKLKPRYVCRYSLEMKLEPCLPEQVLESEIDEVILQALKAEIALAAAERKRVDKQNKLWLSEREKLQQEHSKLLQDIERCKLEKEKLFESFAEGKLSKEHYVTEKAKQSSKSTKIEEKEQEISMKLAEKNSSKEGDNYGIISRYANATELTKNMAYLVNKVKIYKDNRFEVIFNFKRAGRT